MNGLLVRPKILQGQCRQDYLMSLAEANALRGPYDLANRLKTDFSVLINISIDDLSLLISDVDSSHLRKWIPDTRSPSLYLYNWKYSVSRVCPRCLLDGMPISSEFNSILSVSCLLHNLELIDRCSQCGKNLLYTRHSRNFCNCGFDLRKSSCVSANDWARLFYLVFAPWKLSVDAHNRADLNFSKEYDAARILRTYWNLRKGHNWRVVSLNHEAIKCFTNNGWEYMQKIMARSLQERTKDSILLLQKNVFLPRFRTILMLAYPGLISISD